jgi:rhomboid protease GluP
MFERQRTGSLLCPSCRQLVGVNDPECFHCGRRNPGMWGYAGVLRGFDQEHVFVTLVTWACVALFLSSLVIAPSEISFRGDLFSPAGRALFMLGSSGPAPVLGFERWWTVLTAGWLHGGLIHITFNLLWTRDLGPVMARVFGTGRTVLVWVLGGAAGFVASTLAGLVFPPDMFFFGPGTQTVGASASVFALIGALKHFGDLTGNSLLKETIRAWLIGGILIGIILPGINNWAHAGGYLGGLLLARVLDPRHPPRPWHAVAAAIVLVATAVAFGASVAHARDLPMFRFRG